MATHAERGDRGTSRRIAADLREAIRAGRYGAGQQLPSGSALMERYGVARQTVQNAIDLLRAEGLIATRPGAGVFVKERPAVQRLSRNRLSRTARQAEQGAFLGDAAANAFTPRVEVDVRVEPAGPVIADALRIAKDDEVVVRDRVMYANDIAVQLAVSRLPRRVTAGTEIEQTNPGPGGVYGVLERIGHKLDHFVELVATRPAAEREQRLLNLTPGQPVLTVTRIAYDTTGQPVEVNDMVLTGERYELVYEIPAT